MSKAKLTAAGLALVVMVGILSGALRTVEFHPGLPLSALVQYGQPGGMLALPYGWFDRLLHALPWVFLSVLLLGLVMAILSPDFRRALTEALLRPLPLVLILLALFVAVIGNLHRLQPAGVVEPAAVSPPEHGQPAVQAQPAPVAEAIGERGVATPSWAAYLAAAAVAGFLVWLAWRMPRRLRRSTQSRWPAEEHVAMVATQAIAELQAGLALSEVVIRCWTRMAEVLSVRVGRAADAPGVTPRDLVRLLEARGIRHPAIAQLTTLFEEVRYGGKPDEARRSQALAALTAIENAYASA